jgi:predicted permease
MWGLLVGIAIGGLQLLAVNKLGTMILGGKSHEKLLGVLLFIAKMAAIIVILYLISTISLAHLIWTAGGILLGLVLGSVYVLKRRRKTNGDGKDNA